MTYLRTSLRRIFSADGSATVEAALVFPVAVLICAGVISCALRIEARVKDDAMRHRKEAGEYADARIINTENILRTVWVLDE